MACCVCPWWLGYFLANPVRRFMHNPEKILAPFIQENMKVADIGCGMGYFSLTMAKLVGDKGRVIGVDLQKQMIAALRRKAAKSGLSERIETRVCTQNSLGLDDLAGEIDFALTFAMVHEVPDQANLMKEIHAALKNGGYLLVAEPAHHVSKDKFAATVALAQKQGFKAEQYPDIKSSLAVLLRKEVK